MVKSLLQHEKQNTQLDYITYFLVQNICEIAIADNAHMS